MATKTMHVMPESEKGTWVIRKSGTGLRKVFATREQATEAAKELIKGKTGQVIVHSRSGRMISAKSYGLPQIQRSIARGTIESKAIEKAVSSVVNARLRSE